MTIPDPITPREDGKSRQTGRIAIVAQLSILTLVLGSLFSAFLIPETSEQTPAARDRGIESVVVSRPLPEPGTTEISDVALTAEAAYVWDVTRERALYAKNADTVLPLASITKLMTALLAYELVPDETPVSVRYEDILQEGQSGLAPGEQFTARDLADLALIASSNDAAHSLAGAVGERLGDADPTAQFVAAMNLRAEELGLESLSFANPTGLDRSAREAGAYGSAREVSFLVEYILETYPNLLAATTEPSDRIYNAAGEYHTAANTNALIADIPNLIGSKTGYTDLAGGNLTVAFDAGFDRPMVVTVLGSTRSERFSDVANLVRASRHAVSEEIESRADRTESTN